VHAAPALLSGRTKWTSRASATPSRPRSRCSTGRVAALQHSGKPPTQSSQVPPPPLPPLLSRFPGCTPYCSRTLYPHDHPDARSSRCRPVPPLLSCLPRPLGAPVCRGPCPWQSGRDQCKATHVQCKAASPRRVSHVRRQLRARRRCAAPRAAPGQRERSAPATPPYRPPPPPRPWMPFGRS